ncbi:hypothetical protein DFH09DRAFT_1081477 [Mycena vulgaris]|nr:hypothetical protein DFH09DRAFT_1081477 [Mycena vulgaris]
MHTFRILSLMIASSLALVAANPLIAERQTCDCQSPTGCPGRCSVLQGSGHSYCSGYCGRDNAVICDACGFSTLGCIVNDDGSCFTALCTGSGCRVLERWTRAQMEISITYCTARMAIASQWPIMRWEYSFTWLRAARLQPPETIVDGIRGRGAPLGCQAMVPKRIPE